MTTAPVSPLLTAEQFVALPDGEQYELLDGELVERVVGQESSMIAILVAQTLANFVYPSRIGYIFDGSLGLKIFPNRPRRIPRADLTFIRRSRLPQGPSGGLLEVAPDLVVEVVSPGDEASMLERKLSDYREAGIPLIWVIYPATRQVHVIQENGPEHTRGQQDVLTGEPVLPGFSCPVGSLFPD